ncbi:hypothetical protein C8F01DRAFT_1085185 [Mycena amicta]|nr:hypothetical protein C8F01DRAFT_1085185 [Mycena amicta]
MPSTTPTQGAADASDLNRRLARVERRLRRLNEEDLPPFASPSWRQCLLRGAHGHVDHRQSAPPPTTAKPDSPPSLPSPSSVSSLPSDSSSSSSTSRSAARPQYVYTTPERGTVFTSEWAEAGARTQGVPQSHVKKLFESPRDTTPKTCFVVFRSRSIGVKNNWTETQSETNNFSCAVFTGYHSQADATHAFAHADQQGWTSTTPRSPGQLLMEPSDTPRPITAYDLTLFGDRIRTRGSSEKWFVVYIGIRPGVYATWLEAALNTKGIQGSVFHRTDSFELAMQKFAEAKEQRNVHRRRTPSTLCVRSLTTEASKILALQPPVGICFRETRRQIRKSSKTVKFVQGSDTRGRRPASTVVAQRVASAKYRANHAEEVREKARERMARLAGQLSPLPPLKRLSDDGLPLTEIQRKLQTPDNVHKWPVADTAKRKVHAYNRAKIVERQRMRRLIAFDKTHTMEEVAARAVKQQKRRDAVEEEEMLARILRAV